MEAFRKGLRDLGYVEGKNILVEYRYVEGRLDRYPSLAAEFVQLKVDVLVVTNPLSTRAAQQATKTIPIVMVTTNDPVAENVNGLIRRVAGASIEEIDRVIQELQTVRDTLINEGKRLDYEFGRYAKLNHMSMTAMKTIADSLKLPKGSAG